MSRAARAVPPPIVELDDEEEQPMGLAGGLASARGYFARSELPLTSLVFILPLVIIYEIGTRYLTTAAQAGLDQEIIAFRKIQEFFALFGITGRHLPAIAVVGILLACHIARRDAWTVDLFTLGGMVVESLLLGLPLIGMSLLLARYFPLSAGYSPGDVKDNLIMSAGAGVYEELVFRLAMFPLLSLLLKDALRIRRAWSYLLVVLISAICFSAYHYLMPTEHFRTRTFVFRTLAGIYFGVLFITRGFGVTAGSHTAYDIMIMFI
jgi:Type II CAAX prenyl endopeptidase Rce1-like